ncbi:hypothetical protein [Streptomyces tricolor]
MAVEPVPGLYVYEQPEHLRGPGDETTHPWRLGHHSGLRLAAFPSQDDAVRATFEVAAFADWTRDAEDCGERVLQPERLLRPADGAHQRPAHHTVLEGGLMTYESDLAAAKRAGTAWGCACGEDNPPTGAYEVLAIDRGPRQEWPVWQITVRYDRDGQETTHCSGWNPARDRVLTIPQTATPRRVRTWRARTPPSRSSSTVRTSGTAPTPSAAAARTAPEARTTMTCCRRTPRPTPTARCSSTTAPASRPVPAARTSRGA